MGQANPSTGEDPLIDFPTQSIAWNVFIGTEDTPLSFNLPRHGECLRLFSIVGHADDSCFPPGCGAPDVPRRSLPDRTTFGRSSVSLQREIRFTHPPTDSFQFISIISFFFLPSFLSLFFLAKGRKRDYIFIQRSKREREDIQIQREEWILPGSCSRNLPLDGSLKRPNGFLIVLESVFCPPPSGGKYRKRLNNNVKIYIYRCGARRAFLSPIFPRS